MTFKLLFETNELDEHLELNFKRDAKCTIPGSTGVFGAGATGVPVKA